MKTFNFILFLCFILVNNLRGQISENVDLLFNWNEDTLVGSSAYDNVYNEIWGVVINEREYAIIGSTFGTHFFDVTSPQSSLEVAFVMGRAVGSEIIHRDYHDYKGYLYAVSDEGLVLCKLLTYQLCRFGKCGL